MIAKPKIKIIPSAADRLLENIGILLLIALWVLSLVSYIKSPDIVPIHFNGSGSADGFGNKISILLLPLIPTAIYFLLGLLNKYPHVFNYPVTITADNVVKQYTIATKMMRALKIVTLLVFIIITLFSFFAANKITKGIGSWSLPLIIILMSGPTVYYLYRSFRVQ